MEEPFEGPVSFALSALRKSMLVLTRRQKEALKSTISRKDIRRHARDVYLGMCPVQNGVPILMY